MLPSAFSILGPPGPGGEGMGVKSEPKPGYFLIRPEEIYFDLQGQITEKIGFF